MGERASRQRIEAKLKASQDVLAEYVMPAPSSQTLKSNAENLQVAKSLSVSTEVLLCVVVCVRRQ